MKTVVLAIVCVMLVSVGAMVGFFAALSNPQPNGSSSLPEYLLVSEPEFYVGTDGWFAMTINNTGVGSVTIVKVLVNNVKQSSANPPLPFTVAPDNGFVLNVTMAISKGIPYQIDLFTSQGNKFSKLSEVPSHGGQAGVMLYKANTNFYNQNGTLKIDVDIGNSGTSDTQLTTLYVGTSATSLLNQTIAPVPLAAGTVARITIDYPWTKGVTYYFKVLSSTGQTIDWPEQAPVA
jgi:hypothetical protein